MVLVWLLVWILKLLVLHFWPILYLPALVPLLLFLFVDMVFIDILLLGLALDGLGIGGHFPHTMAAYAEMAVALISLYGAGAGFLNNFYGRQFWPVGAPLGIWKK